MDSIQKKQQQIDFWSGRGPCLIFIPATQMPQYDTADYEQQFYNPRKMWDVELERARSVAGWPTDGIPAARPNLGTIFIPACAGQQCIVKNGQMPWPGAHFTAEQIAAVADKDFTDAEVLKLAAEFYRIHREEGPEGIFPYLADTQGVFDILHLLMGDALFYELTDDAERIKELLATLTDVYADLSLRLKKMIGENSLSMMHGHGTPQGLFFPEAGVRLSEDTATLLSPLAIEEFVLPYMKKAAELFGGAFVHFCGKHDYLYERILECDFVKAIDLGNPELFETKWLLETCARTHTVFYGKLAAQKSESWQDYIKRIASCIKETGARCVLRPAVFPESMTDCRQMQEMWHQLTDA